MAGAITVEEHYGAQDISARVCAALARSGCDMNRLTREDLMPFDEFHGGGIASTRNLADYAELTPDLQVLDVGAGIGGPARTLAAEYGCRVSGVDLTPAFVAVADMLTARVGLSRHCEFQHGSATGLPFAASRFDVVWSQNMLMNVADKATFFAEVARVLKPGGRFAFECVLRGSDAPIYLPTFWASCPEINFLVSLGELEALLTAAGLVQIGLEDTSASVLANATRREAAVTSHDATQLSIAVIVPEDVEQKLVNGRRNLEQGRTVTVKGVYRRGDA